MKNTIHSFITHIQTDTNTNTVYFNKKGLGELIVFYLGALMFPYNALFGKESLVMRGKSYAQYVWVYVCVPS